MRASVPVGPIFDAALDLAHTAGQHVLVFGDQGVGKSVGVARWASQRNLARVELDLSQIESVGDLIGLPRVSGDRTELVPPRFLPDPSDRREGVLHLEELLRATPWVSAILYSLLTSGSIGPTYRLPRGWTVIATANPVDGTGRFDGRALDAAARDRFVIIDVVPSLASWLAWARSGDVHGAVVSFIENAGERALLDPDVSPRAWEHVSRLTHAHEELDPENRNDEALVAVLSGCIGNRWAASFIRHYLGGAAVVLSPGQVLDEYGLHRAAFVQAIQVDGRLDIASATAARVLRFVAQKGIAERIVADSRRRLHLECFWTDLPADIRQRAREVLAAKGISALWIPEQP